MLCSRQLRLVVVLLLFGGVGESASAQVERSPLPPSAPGCGQQSSVLSPNRLHSAYISCLENAQARTIRLTVLDSAGNVVSNLSAQLKESCAPGALQWLDDDRIGVVCATDPEVKTYVIFDIHAHSEQQYRGYSFTWSPDGKAVADVKLDVMFGTPVGENSCLFLNGLAVYPAGCDHARESYSHIHTFLTPVLWSPDSAKVAFVEKIFDWEYADPFLRYFDGAASDVHYDLVIASIDHTASGYPLSPADAQQTPVWQTNSRLMLGNQSFDLQSRPPSPIP